MKKKFIYFFSIIILLVVSLSIGLSGKDSHMNKNLAVEIPPIPEKTVELAALYFPDKGRQYLVKENRVIEHTVEQREKIVLEELIKGPENTENGVVIPSTAKIHSIITKNGTAYVHLSNEFKTDLQIGNNSEILAVYSIVNSLTELKGIKNVELRVEGEKEGFLQKHMPLDYVYRQNLKLVNNPIMTPIEVVKSYFALIENEDYRQAFDLLYNPANLNIDYSMYYRYQKERGTKEHIINSYKMVEQGETIVITFNYIERTWAGDEFHYDRKNFKLKNYHGEWKIMMDSIPKNFFNYRLQ